MKEPNSFKCNYINHKNDSSNSYELYYCDGCDILICSQCLGEHNSKNENLNHKSELLNTILKTIDKKRKELEEQPYMNDKNIINLKSNKNDNFMENKVKQYMDLCNELNNYYRNQYSEYRKNFLEMEKLKDNFRKKVEKNPMLLLRDADQDIDNINKIYEGLIQKEKNINQLFNLTSNLLNEGNIERNILNFRYEKIDDSRFTISSRIKPNNQLFKSIVVRKEKDETQNKENNNDLNSKKSLTNSNSNITENKNEMINKKITVKKPMFAIYPSTNKKDKTLTQNSNKIINKNNLEEKNENNKDIHDNKNNLDKKNYINNNIMKYNSKNIIINNINHDLNMKSIVDENKNIINKKGNFLTKYSNLSNEMFLSLKTERKNNKDSFLLNNNMSKNNYKKPKIQNNNLNKFYPNNNIFMVSNSSFISDFEEKKDNSNNNNNNNIKYSFKELIPNLKKDTIIYKKMNNIIKQNNLNENEKSQKNDEANHININENDLNETKYLFGISTYQKNYEKRLVVFEMKQNVKISIKLVKSSDIVHTEDFLYSEKFPYPYCRLVNINNKAYVIGGNKQDDFNDLGNNFCFQIYCQRNEEDSSLDKVICTPMKFTNYRHQSHCLLYSDKYKTIFVLSGHNQKKCEYAKINEKGCITEWEELLPLKEPREDCLGFLFNEKYIFLIGGKKYEENNNYEVFDFSSLYENRRPMWKHYRIEYNFINKNLFDSKGSGIIEYKNKIYILGGYNNSKEVSSWKITFSTFKDEININRIESFSMNSFENISKSKGYSFLGEPKFINFGNNYYNIGCGGRCKSISKKILDNGD